MGAGQLERSTQTWCCPAAAPPFAHSYRDSQKISNLTESLNCCHEHLLCAFQYSSVCIYIKHSPSCRKLGSRASPRSTSLSSRAKLFIKAVVPFSTLSVNEWDSYCFTSLALIDVIFFQFNIFILPFPNNTEVTKFLS